MELLCFLKEYFVSPKLVGGPAPSSKELAELITDAAGVREANVVIEFGPGTGVFTEVIARKLRRGGKFLAIEISDEFVKAVQRRCPNVTVVHDSAANARKHLEQQGLDSCDCIVSGLPFAIFEDKLQNEILDAAYDVLRPGGVFVTFTYFMSPLTRQGRRLKRKLAQRFDSLDKTAIVWRNVLPAFAYRAIKK